MIEVQEKSKVEIHELPKDLSDMLKSIKKIDELERVAYCNHRTASNSRDTLQDHEGGAVCSKCRLNINMEDMVPYDTINPDVMDKVQKACETLMDTIEYCKIILGPYITGQEDQYDYIFQMLSSERYIMQIPTLLKVAQIIRAKCKAGEIPTAEDQEEIKNGIKELYSDKVEYSKPMVNSEVLFEDPVMHDMNRDLQRAVNSVTGSTIPAEAFACFNKIFENK